VIIAADAHSTFGYEKVNCLHELGVVLWIYSGAKWLLSYYKAMHSLTSVTSVEAQSKSKKCS